MSRAEITAVGAFRQFHRHQYEQQGMGLGLAIVQRLAALHQGAFQIESAPGEGTMVHVTLPLAT